MPEEDRPIDVGAWVKLTGGRSSAFRVMEVRRSAETGMPTHVLPAGSNVWRPTSDVEPAEQPPLESFSALEVLSDGELLSLLDEVSAELKRRNGLLPQTGGGALSDLLTGIAGLSKPSA